MKKLLAFLLLPAIILTGCGGPEEVVEIDSENPYYVLMIGEPEFEGWFDYMKEQRAQATQNLGNVFLFENVESAYDSKDAIADFANKSTGEYNYLVFVGLGPNDYEGGSLEDAEISLKKNKAFVNELKEITLKNDVLLLVSNGYPKPADQTDEHLLWNHEEMRLFLAEEMKTTNKIYLFALKRELGDPTTGAHIAIDDITKYEQLTGTFQIYLDLIKKRL